MQKTANCIIRFNRPGQEGIFHAEETFFWGERLFVLRLKELQTRQLMIPIQA
jgi:hypothetical protein